MRIVLDTDVMVAAFRSRRGASRQILIEALTGRLTMLVSVPLIVEYEAVLTRPDQLAAMAATEGEVNQLLDTVTTVAEPVRMSFLWRPRLRDADDEMVLETAVNGMAEYLVSFNQKHLHDAAAEFGIRAIRPGELLKRLREKWNEAK